MLTLEIPEPSSEIGETPSLVLLDAWDFPKAGFDAQKECPIGINRRKSPSPSVGARAVERRGEGLYGRPSSLSVTFTHPIANHTGLRGRP